HKWQLVEAERYALVGNLRKAEYFYETSISNAHRHGFPGDEALAHELAGLFFLARNKETSARMHLEQAYSCYEEWGAAGKMAQMEHLYPALLKRVSGRRCISHAGYDMRDHDLDVQTVVRAVQKFSSEIHLDKLSSCLMHLLIENAGAQKGALLMMEHGRLFVYAEVSGESIEIGSGLALEKSCSVSQTVINYVKRTGERVVLGDAAHDSQFNGDAYIEREQTKSILCLPLQKQGQLVGILYMENNLAVDAFTSHQAEMLQILSTQIAMSLENAALYNELEKKVELRTQALTQKNAELRATLDSLRRTQTQLVESAKLAS